MRNHSSGLVDTRPLRRDAAQNQERVLAAAVAMFARDGREVSMAAIAAQAGVGVGTLYRRYPTREALMEALTERSFELVLHAAHSAETSAQPAIVALDAFYDTTIGHRNELVLPLHGGPTTLTESARQSQSAIRDVIARLLDRGRHDRTIRDDVTAADVIAFGALLAHTLAPDESWVALLHRQKQIYLAGLTPHRETLRRMSEE